MILITQRMIKKQLSEPLYSEVYQARILRTTWWLLWIFPVFCKEEIISHQMRS